MAEKQSSSQSEPSQPDGSEASREQSRPSTEPQSNATPLESKVANVTEVIHALANDIVVMRDYSNRNFKELQDAISIVSGQMTGVQPTSVKLAEIGKDVEDFHIRLARIETWLDTFGAAVEHTHPHVGRTHCGKCKRYCGEGQRCGCGHQN